MLSLTSAVSIVLEILSRGPSVKCNKGSVVWFAQVKDSAVWKSPTTVQGTGGAGTRCPWREVARERDFDAFHVGFEDWRAAPARNAFRMLEQHWRYFVSSLLEGSITKKMSDLASMSLLPKPVEMP
jgi:hypothetical protein